MYDMSVPPALRAAVRCDLLEARRRLNDALEAEANYAARYWEWLRLVGYGTTDAGQYMGPVTALMAAHAREDGFPDGTIARCLQVTTGQVDELCAAGADYNDGVHGRHARPGGDEVRHRIGMIRRESFAELIGLV
ncbi:hypothetical protein [Peterkaempfera griseoplana]|uniref:hypothetical protein n=1 Tax=Peterkaempfera griseoplana TaxID=66896 RepID=UPI0006E2EF49|nr:hypothetical protein [Peterkaempfera griseoplana]